MIALLSIVVYSLIGTVLVVAAAIYDWEWLPYFPSNGVDWFDGVVIIALILGWPIVVVIQVFVPTMNLLARWIGRIQNK